MYRSIRCINLTTSYNSAAYLPRTFAHEDRVAWLYVNALPTVTTVTQGEALQLAIWDIIHDNGDGLTVGRVQSSTSTPTAVITQVATYLANSLGQSSLAASIYISSIPVSNVPAQTLVGFLQPGSPTGPVPEPGTFGLIGVAAGLTMLVRRRRKSAATSAAPARR